MPGPSSRLQQILRRVETNTGLRADVAALAPVRGGSISSSYRIPTDHGPIFVKVGDATALNMFEAEADGLAALTSAAAVRIPKLVDVGVAANHAYLVLDWIDFSKGSAAAERRLGSGLARQHRISGKQFGWHRDNTIGSTPQLNAPEDDWLAFLRRRRIGYQLDRAAANGLSPRSVERAQQLLGRLEVLFGVYRPIPSLLHGDLWAGNWGADSDGIPYIFDPAVYFGDREAELALTRLFGGFGREFYAAYASEWPLADGWERRVDLYNLYHLLNHFNLFGGAYLEQIDATIRRLLDASS